MSSLIERMAVFVLPGDDFSSDDVTANGTLTLDGGHSPNGTNNGIGSMFQWASREKLIEFTGEVTKSKAKHRKGGMIRVWRGTPKGARWARMILDE